MKAMEIGFDLSQCKVGELCYDGRNSRNCLKKIDPSYAVDVNFLKGRQGKLGDSCG